MKTMTDEEYAMFLTRLPEAGVRDRCILLLLLHTGLRNGELCALRIQDLYAQKQPFHQIEVANGHGHHRHFRMLPLTGQLIDALSEYYTARSARFGAPDPASPAFITLKRKMGIQQRDVQRIAKHYTLLWLSRAFTPHSFRHTYATRLMRKASLRVVQQLLGHLSISSTQIYTHPSQEDMSRAVNDAF